ncbi:MAG TPA: multidrug resistance protein [Microcoleaceae bacterium UBA10368]|jgi:drug resistance transporter, Bcr/CflA subfamily|nr:multidrug resistance protein [Microcoleaceae cyanobacterium UBA11344]HBK96555.1 multidrug resistance protein [Microcoleaceae cyanobacterium UBA10368]HCV32620.1 multidrug resistance protein [Microcoleaceae cyanobacterium UBA9251]
MKFKPNDLGFTIILGVLAALLPLSIDMGLPAFPAIGTSLNASPAAVGLTLSLFMAGYAISQLAFGPLSDRYGRKPVLLAGCGLFAFASAACAIAPSINSLVAWRFFQGAGAGAGMTLMLAMVRDLFEGATARVQLSYISLAINIAPIIAPTIGVGILAIANWRSIYGLLAVGGLILLLAIALGLDESIKSRDLNAIKPHRLIGNYLRVLNNRVFIGYALVDALSFGCLFAYVAASSLVMINVLGISTTTYGLIFALTGIGIVAGSFLSGLLNNRGVPSSRLLGFGLVISATSAITLVLVSMTGAAQLLTLLPLLIINTFCYGLIAPNAIHHALESVEDTAGSAAASIGFLEMLGGSLASVLVSFLFDGHTVNVMSEVMALFAIASLATYSQVRFNK